MTYHPFEGIGDGGDNFGTLDEALADYFPNILEQTRGLVISGNELVLPIQTADGVIHISDEQLESVAPGEQSGSFLVRLKGTINDHEKVVRTMSVIVTGGAILAGIALMRQRRKR